MTTIRDRQLSEAIIAFLGRGKSAFPQNDDDAVVAAVGAADSPAFLARVRTITDECMAVEVDWSRHSLSEGGEEARQAMVIRHPELSPDALDALRWMFTYNWR